MQQEQTNQLRPLPWSSGMTVARVLLTRLRRPSQPCSPDSRLPHASKPFAAPMQRTGMLPRCLAPTTFRSLGTLQQGGGNCSFWERLLSA